MTAIEALDRELGRLHKEIASFNASPPIYLQTELNRLNALLIELARKEVSK